MKENETMTGFSVTCVRGVESKFLRAGRYGTGVTYFFYKKYIYNKKEERERVKTHKIIFYTVKAFYAKTLSPLTHQKLGFKKGSEKNE